MVWVSLVYTDTQTQGSDMGEDPLTFQDGLVYMDTQTQGIIHGWTSSAYPGWSGYPWCTRILRHRGYIWVEILGYSRMVWVSLVMVIGGHPWIVHDGLGILDVHGYSDTGVWYGWRYSDIPGWSG